VEKYLLEALVCPACQGELDWQLEVERDGRLEQGEARCRTCATLYPAREGIGLFLTPDLPRNDLWEQVGSALGRYLSEHPEIERLLVNAPLETLGPADLFYRALALEERGRFQEAREAAQKALPGLYTSEYLSCYRSQLDYVLEQLRPGSGWVLDLASGRGELAERIATELGRPVVATDFSPRVLRQNRRRLEALGLYRGISLLCCDARRTPFRTGSVETMTSNLGLANIEQPAGLLSEIGRVLSGELLAVTVFYPGDDALHIPLLQQYGLAQLLLRDPALELFAQAGFQVALENVRRGIARPTPKSTLLEGAGIDGLPVAETVLEWCVLRARPRVPKSATGERTRGRPAGGGR